MEVSGHLHGPAALSPGKNNPVPIGYEAGCAQSRSGYGGEEKSIPSLPRRELNPGRPVSSLVTTLTELHRPLPKK
jgi:hypothetical protein